MSAHTPGPWVAKHNAGAGLGIWADLRPALGEKYARHFEIIGSASLPAPRVQIAYEAWIQFPTAKWEAMQEANMRLAAAAPDLLARLVDAVASFADSVEGGEADEWVQLSRAAIAKATGKEL